MKDITGTLTICRKAGKLTGGMDEVKNCCRRGDAYGVIVSSDISDNSLSEISYVCDTEGVQMYKIGLTTDEIGSPLGKAFAILAVTDGGFMKAMKKGLTEL